MQIHFFARSLVGVTFLSVAFAIQLAWTAPAPAQNVQIDYQSTEGTASVSPFTIPNPDTGVEIAIVPTLTISQGEFTTRFSSDANGQILGGYASVSDLVVSGEADITLGSSIEVFGFPVSVTANLTGPISMAQVSPSVGRLEEEAFVELSPGLFNVSLGPVECADNVLGVFCSIIEDGLGVALPMDAVSLDASPLPFAAGTFADLNTEGESVVRSQITLSIPLGDDATVDADVNFVWSEIGRESVVPEPSSPPLLFVAAIVLAVSRQRFIVRT